MITVKDDNFWALFRETGEPFYWLMSRERQEQNEKARPEPVKTDEGAAKA